MGNYLGLVNVKFYVLLALASEPMHGLAIQRQIVGDGLGIYIRTSTLYAALGALVRDGAAEPAGNDGHRRTYQITERGRRLLKLEVQTLRRAGQLAGGRLFFPTQ